MHKNGQCVASMMVESSLIQCLCGHTFTMFELVGYVTSCPKCDNVSESLKYVGKFRNQDVYRVVKPAYIIKSRSKYYGGSS